MQQNKEDFVQIIKANEGIIYKITHIYAKDEEERKDLYQEIVYQMWKSFPSFKGKAKVSTWLYRVALNTSIAHLNKTKKTTHAPLDDFQLWNIEDEEDTEFRDRMQLLHDHIQRLSVVEKGLILLYLEGKSYEEIATITGFSATNVGTRLGRIRQKLKTNIKK
ncbi:sigma-70 family RNA polymerase sigma factor [Aureisphaera galaxeae]|uniref:RNA polymerase sigma factor n=1 Tax=Aureisphaera galaxeae TaxID=1538023 RepID=UPI0023501417|nr:sigma-70 family RNA polymerase sigma factor [Aureisphaera galaxeae]MDC8003375.1 sigma-70 family RNA polymerase sigma factor [Aureisphaera galaxeae]